MVVGRFATEIKKNFSLGKSGTSVGLVLVRKPLYRTYTCSVIERERSETAHNTFIVQPLFGRMHRSLSARSRCSERALAASSLRRVRFSPSASAALSTRQTASRSDDVPSSPSLSGSSSAPPWSSSAFDLAVLMQPIGRDGAPNMADRYMKLPRFITAQGMREASGFPLGDGPPLLVTTSVVMHGATAWALLGGAATMPGGVELALGAGSFALRMFGITAGYHRYFAHGSYKTSRAFQFVLGVLGASAWQKGERSRPAATRTRTVEQGRRKPQRALATRARPASQAANRPRCAP